ncbi:MAG: TIM barrel protein [Polaromonas sp.]|nr:TIM barrel protein [Polaromonas sp.]
MTDLSLGYLSLPGASATDLVQSAHSAGLPQVGLRIAGRRPDDAGDWVADDPAALRTLQAALQHTGIRVMNVAAHYVDGETRVADFSRAFDTAAALGARFFCLSSYDADESRLSQTLGALAEAAAARRLTLALEFVPYSQTRTLDAACRVIEGARAGNLGVLLDLLHFMRSGSSLQSLRVAARHIGFVQLCDGTLQSPAPEHLADEARGGRLYPGEGAFPLADILGALPAGLPLEIEVPHASVRHLPFADQAIAAATAVLRYLETAPGVAPSSNPSTSLTFTTQKEPA